MDSETLHKAIIKDLYEIQKESGYPTFSWNAATYPCVASVAELKRENVSGGFIMQKLLTLTVQKYDLTNTPIFPNNVIPQSQQHLTYLGDDYRIELVKEDGINDYDEKGNVTALGSKLRITAVSAVRGVSR